MRKLAVLIASLGLVAALAAPALADSSGSSTRHVTAHADTPPTAGVVPPASKASSTVKPHKTPVIRPERIQTDKLSRTQGGPTAPAPRQRKPLAGYLNPDAGLKVKPLTPQKTAPGPIGSRAALSPNASAAAAPTVSSFTGMNISQACTPNPTDPTRPTCWNPADVTAAPGVNDVVETVNSALAAYSKTGTTLIAPTPLVNWFGLPNNTTTKIFDPHVTIDPKSSQYAMVATDGSNWLLSVAQQTSATGSWCKYTIPAAISGHFADFPQIGVDSRYIYLTIVDYPDPTSGTPEDSRMVALPRGQVESCQPAVGPKWTGITDPGTACLLCVNDQYAFRISPATVYDSLDGNGWMADAYPQGGSHITVHYVDSSNTLNSYQVSTPTYSKPSPAQQSGTNAPLLHTGLVMFTGLNKTAGELYLALNSGYDWGGGNVNSVVTWMQIHADPTSLTSGLALDKYGSFGYPGLWYFYPSSSGTAPSGYGQVFNFSVSGASIHPSNAVSAVDNTGAVVGTLYTAVGTGIEAGGLAPDCGVPNCYRWGDYTSTLIDPTTPNTWWTGGIWEASGWSTSISRLGQ